MSVIAERSGHPEGREFEPQVLEELQGLAGRWVAATHTKVVAIGDTPTEVYEAAKSQGIDVPTVFQVPESGAVHYFF